MSEKDFMCLPSPAAPQESSKAVEASQTVAPPMWLLMKRGLYFMPNACGYTGLKREAGRYTEMEAREWVEHDAKTISMVPEHVAHDYAPKCYDDIRATDLQRRLDICEAENRVLRRVSDGRRNAVETEGFDPNDNSAVGCEASETPVLSPSLTQREIGGLIGRLHEYGKHKRSVAGLYAPDFAGLAETNNRAATLVDQAAQALLTLSRQVEELTREREISGINLRSVIKRGEDLQRKLSEAEAQLAEALKENERLVAERDDADTNRDEWLAIAKDTESSLTTLQKRLEDLTRERDEALDDAKFAERIAAKREIDANARAEALQNRLEEVEGALAEIKERIQDGSAYGVIVDILSIIDRASLTPKGESND